MKTLSVTDPVVTKLRSVEITVAAIRRALELDDMGAFCLEDAINRGEVEGTVGGL